VPAAESEPPQLHVTSAAYDGRTLSLTWTGAPDARYNVQVAKSDQTVVAETVVEGLSAMLDFAAEPGAGYTVDVSEATGAANLVGGPVSFVTDGCTVTSAATSSDRQVTIEWEPPDWPPRNVSGFVPVVLWEGTETPLAEQDGDARSATLSLPASIPGGGAIAVRAMTGNSIGPLGNAAPILTLAPEDVEVSYDDVDVHVSWTPLADVRVDGYDVTLAVGGEAPRTKHVSASACTIAYARPSPPEPAVSVTVAAATGPSTGPASAPVDVVLDAPSISSAAFGGETATVAWSAVTQPAAVDGYRLELRSGETTVASVTVSGTEGTVAVPAGGGPFSVRVLALAPSSTGRPSASVGLLAGTPQVLSVKTPPADDPTLTWTEVDGASGYMLVVTLDGEAQPPVSVPGTTYKLQHPLTPSQDVAVAVAATGSASGAALSGPYGPRFRLPSAVPPITSVDFYGTQVVVGWERVVEGSSSYHAAVLVPPSTVISEVDADPSAGSALLPFPVGSPSGDYAVSLQAQFGPSTGPTGTTAPLVEEALYVGAPSGVPVVFRAGSLPLAPAAATVYLPSIGPLVNLPFSGSAAPSPPFVVAANDDAGTKARYPYTLTIANGALAFTTSDAIRADVQKAYGELLAAASTNKATPWGIWVLQQAIARVMPQTFAETLFYAYGLLPTGQSADLRPGMILRVAYAAFDTPATKPPVWSTGYAGAAAVDYELGDYFDSGGRTWLVGFDAFVAWLASNSIVTVPDPQTMAPPPSGPAYSESGAAEAADLFFPDFRQPFYRLFFPSSLQPTTPPAQQLTAQQFTIAAAGTWPVISSAKAWPSQGVKVAYFRGRAVVKLAIRVVVNGVEEVVPIGTTVGNVLDRLGRRPPSTSVGLRGVTLERSLGPAVFDPSVPYDAGGGYRVRLDWDPLLVVGAPYDATSLPLLHGDRLTVGTP
jgi:hypothetical protein